MSQHFANARVGARKASHVHARQQGPGDLSARREHHLQGARAALRARSRRVVRPAPVASSSVRAAGRRRRSQRQSQRGQAHSLHNAEVDRAGREVTLHFSLASRHWVEKEELVLNCCQ